MPLVSSTVTGGVKQIPSWAMFTIKPIQALDQKVGVAVVSFLQQKSLILDHMNDQVINLTRYSFRKAEWSGDNQTGPRAKWE